MWANRVLLLGLLLGPTELVVAYAPQKLSVALRLGQRCAFSSRMYSTSSNAEGEEDYAPDERSELRASTIPEYDPEEKIRGKRKAPMVGDPQQKSESGMSVQAILKELAEIQRQGPRKYCVLGTRHCSFLHQQIIELLAYALVLSGNHVYTSGAVGTHAATIRGALRAERQDLLTVVLPQSRTKQPSDIQKLLWEVEDVHEMPQNDHLSLDIASRKCNSYLLSLSDQLISFAFHESSTVIEANKEAKSMNMLVTTLFLD